jgi:hypothetical protein
MRRGGPVVPRWARLAVVLLLVPLGAMVVAAVPNAGYWGQPDAAVTVTHEVPAGEATRGRSTCPAARFLVEGPAGRAGEFRGCADAHAVGERLTVRWRSATSPGVRVDVMGPADVLRIGGLTALVTAAVTAVVAVLVAVARRRRTRGS